MDRIQIGNRIKEMREKAGLTQAQLAEEMDGFESDSGKTKISNYEKGRNLTLDNIERIYKVLSRYVRFDEDYLLGCIPHPHVSTSWISEIVPLSREAIESLEYLRYQFEMIGNEDAAWLSKIIDNLIIDIVNSYKSDFEEFTLNLIDMVSAFEAVEDYESGESNNIEFKEYQYAKLAISATSTKIGSFLSDSVKESLKEYVHKDAFVSDDEEA